MRKSGRQISILGMMAYAALWALVIFLFRQAAKLQQGTHTIAEARWSDLLILTATGLIFVAIGLPIAIIVGRSRQANSIALGCFFVGFLAIPILIFVLLALSRFGIIDLDL